MGKINNLIVGICESYRNGKSIKEIQDEYPEYKEFMTERYIVNILIVWYSMMFKDDSKG